MNFNYKNYISILKPGIIRGNIINFTAGFFFASKGNLNFSLYVATMIGLAMIVASGCVFNNYIDKNIDKKMSRTKKRVLVTGIISGRFALAYASLLGIAGAICLFIFSDILAFWLSLLGLFMYVVVYGIAKRATVYGTEIGSISGAIPPLVGYVAASGKLDFGAILVFIIYVLWQMPHFYSIAIFRMKDYAAAGIPVLPIVKGVKAAKIRILVYVVLLTIISVGSTLLKFTGIVFLITMLSLGIAWFRYGYIGLGVKDNVKWAGKMFGLSLLVVLGLDLAFILNSWLP